MRVIALANDFSSVIQVHESGDFKYTITLFPFGADHEDWSNISKEEFSEVGDTSLINLIHKVFSKATGNLKYPEEPSMRIADVTIIFSTCTKEGIVQSGKLLESQKGPATQHLISIAHSILTLSQLNQDNNSIKVNLHDLKGDIQKAASEYLRLTARD